MLENIKDRYEKTKFFYQNKDKYKIYDCFLFFNENELLEIRLNELWDIVDYFIIVESHVTFSKKSKPFNISKDLLNRYKEKIIYIQNKEYIKSPNPWETEKSQRNKIIEGIDLPYLPIRSDPNDLIILSDLDEIPNRNAIINSFYKIYQENVKYIKLYLKSFRYAFNNIEKNKAQFLGPSLCKRKDIETMDKLRHQKNDVFYIYDAGWHYSFVMEPKDIIEKLSSYSHQEYNKWPNNDINFIKDRIKRGQSALGHEENTFEVIDLNIKNTPKYLLKNIKKYDKLLFNNEKITTWSKLMSFFSQKICKFKEYSMGIRNKSSEKINTIRIRSKILDINNKKRT